MFPSATDENSFFKVQFIVLHFEAWIEFLQQVWVKTAEVLARDRLLGSFSVSYILQT